MNSFTCYLVLIIAEAYTAAVMIMQTKLIKFIL